MVYRGFNFELELPIELLAALESAAFAVTRLDEGLRRSPITNGWTVRAHLRGACAAATDEGYDVAPERLWPALIGAPTPLERDYGALRRTLELYHIITCLARRPAPRWFRAHLDDTARAELVSIYQLERRMRRSTAGTLPALAHAATVPDRDLPRSHYRLAMAALCRRRGLLSRIAPALMPRADPRVTKARALTRLGSNAHLTRRELQALEMSWRHAHQSVIRSGKTALRQGATLPRLINLLYTLEAVPPRWGAKLLGVSEPQMGRLLARLERLGLAREITGRGSHRLWTTPDVVLISRGRPAFAMNASPRDRPEHISNRPTMMTKKTSDADLAEILDDIDRAVSKARRVIADRT